MIEPIHQDVLNWFLYFTFSSFIGWLLETGWRSMRERKFVNSGFLSGPFVPIYGFGALSIAFLARMAARANGFMFWVILVIAPTVLEYVASWLLEKSFGLRLWDYRSEPFNLKGRVCLLFSGFWAVLTVIAISVVEPFLLERITGIVLFTRYFLTGAFLMYFAMDTVWSVRSLINFKTFIAELKEVAARGGAFLPSLELGARRLPREIRRLLKPLKAFPSLVGELKPMLHAIPEWVTSRLESIVGGRHFLK